MKKLLLILPFLIFFSFTSATAQDWGWSKKESKQLVEKFKKSGFIKRVDAEDLEVYVNQYQWDHHTNAEQKQQIITLMAEYMKYFNTLGIDNRPETYIYDWKSGEELGHYSVMWGVQINTD